MNGDWLIVAAMVIATAATGVLHREKLAPKPSSNLFSCSGPQGRTAGDWACIDEHWTYVAPKPRDRGASWNDLPTATPRPSDTVTGLQNGGAVNYTVKSLLDLAGKPPDCVTSADGKYKICNRPLLPSENCVGEVTIKGGVATVTACSGNGNIEEWSNTKPTGTVTGLLPSASWTATSGYLPIQSVPMTIPAGTYPVIVGQNGGGGGGSGSDNRYTTTFDGHKCRFNAAHVMFCE